MAPAPFESGYLLRLLQRGASLGMLHARPMKDYDSEKGQARDTRKRGLEDRIGRGISRAVYRGRCIYRNKVYFERKAEGAPPAKRMSQAELAKLVHSSHSRVARMEAGDPFVSMDLLIKSLLALGVSKKELARSVSDTTLNVA